MKEKSLINTSKYLIPFMFEEKVCKKLFQETDWNKYELRPFYLANYIKELYSNQGDKICEAFYLKKESWNKYLLPNRFAECVAEVRIPGVEGNYKFVVSSIFVYLFSTGIGALTIEVQHKERELNRIANLNFALINIFSNEHDSDEKNNRINFTVGEDNFSLKNAVKEILMLETFNENDIKLFPNTGRRKIVGYHNLYSENKEVNEKLLVAIERGLGEKAFIEDSDIEDEKRVIGGQNWYIGSSGSVAFSAVTKENKDFIINVRQKNVNIDYFCLYLLGLHEREILLRYNYLAVKYCKKPKLMAKLKPQLIHVNVLFAYNTVSTEKVYQSFYDAVFEEMNLANLETDINEVIHEADDYINEIKDKKLNAVMSAVALLAVISVFTDGMGLADRIASGEPFGAIHFGILAVIFLTIIVSLIALFRKR